MVKRKLKQNQKTSDDEIESRRPVKQFKKQNKWATETSIKNVSVSSNGEHDSSRDSDSGNLPGTSDTAADDSYYENFSSFMKAFCFDPESDDEHQKFNDISQNASNGYENSMNNIERRNSHIEVSQNNSASHEIVSEEELETNIRFLSIPCKLSNIVLLQHPASLTLHGYVEVIVWLGSVNILGYKVKEGEDIKVFSTEGTGLKKVTTVKSVHKSTIEVLKNKLKRMTYYEGIDVEEFVDNVGPTSVVIIVKKISPPDPLQILELYYPNAVQTRWPKSENSEKEKNFEVCSNEQSFVIDISKDFKKISRQVNKVIRQTVSDDAPFGPRIIVIGDRNMGKSTLLRYLINSSLNNHPMVFFLDTDPGQTEYTPPGVVSLVKVTKPLLGPPFTHQKKPHKMFYIGSITPATSPQLYKESIERLMQYFNTHFAEQTLFVNTMGWNKGVGELCIRSIREAVKPTIVIELVSPGPNVYFTKEVVENGVTLFTAPSRAPPRESGEASYNAKELRNFSLVSYLGQCKKPYLPISLINSFQPVCVCWDEIALYVMGKKVPYFRLVEAMHCSIVALCRVDLSLILRSNNPDIPLTLADEPLNECLGFGLVRASDEENHLLYIVTPLSLDQLKNVNALIKGNIMVPDEIILKQTIENIPLPFTDHSQEAKTPARKTLRKRAFFRSFTKTP